MFIPSDASFHKINANFRAISISIKDANAAVTPQSSFPGRSRATRTGTSATPTSPALPVYAGFWGV